MVEEEEEKLSEKGEEDDNIANGPSRFLKSDRLNPSLAPPLLPPSRPVEPSDLLKKSFKPPNELSLFKKGAIEWFEKTSPLQRLDRI